jgi:type I restriction-modification system DNA methylase subunit
MPYLQNSVLRKHLKSTDKHVIDVAYAKLTAHFHNPVIQENIRGCKEEQYQGEFMIDLFVNVLGYTGNPEPGFNLTTEYKNVKDSKKADGAIIINGVVKAVIELKGTNTTDLGKIENQAFAYKNNQPDCVYVVTSNFEKLRFYIDNAIEHIEFNLFTLTREEFDLLWLCLAQQNIASGLPQKIKQESLSQEDQITKKLYNDYSLFKRELHQNIVELNPQFDAIILFKKSQKLLDRFLFLFFAEDRLLLPPNSVRLILNDWKDLQERDVVVPLYDRFKKYFGYLNTGFKGKRYDVFAYNGGLFKTDDILDAVIIDDDLLFKHTLKISAYDFASEVDVNILGHIFENSLNDLDEIKAQIEGTELVKSKTKRKKDGVYYTPKYITKYIVDNTIGKLCTEKKIELRINDEEYILDKKRPKKTTILLSEKLAEYREWLLHIKVCDPACGSGAFLNQALNFLIEEHRFIDELQAKLFGDAIVLSDIENSILENNLFGVDINEESVEIAKLSLWLRTARPNRKLNDLNNNIKCGNSLIDDPAVAGEKAFNWFEEFPQVFPYYRKQKIELKDEEPEPGDKDYLDELEEPSFSYKTGSKGFEKHGFDVVIGNPPYGAFLNNREKSFFKLKYKTLEYYYDTYNFFFEISIKLLKINGYLGFITPNTFVVVENGILLRKLLFLENTLIELYETFDVFPDAVVEPLISIIRKQRPKNDSKFTVIMDARDKITTENRIFNYCQIFDRENIVFNYRETEVHRSLFNKIRNQSSQLSNFAKVTTGIKPYQIGKGIPKQTDEIVKEKPYNSYFQKEGWNRLIRGAQINRYVLVWDGEYINYGNWLAEPRSKEIFFEQKLLIRRTDDKLLGVFDDKKYIGVNSIHCVQSINSDISNKYLLALINSKLINWYFRQENFHMVGKPLAEVKVVFVERLPIKIIDQFSQGDFSEKTDVMLFFNMQLQETSGKFKRSVKRKFSIESLPEKLSEWYLLSYSEFIKELGKKKIKLSLTEEPEWEEYFIQESKKAIELKTKIDNTDREIDKMVYALYELTDEEIEIVEAS